MTVADVEVVVPAYASTGVPKPSAATIATPAMVRFTMLVIRDLSKEHTNGIENSFENDVNQMKKGCETLA
jgi:ABC-type proline/glycine betaine transport system permease subunit